ncbi:hypothetical protein ACPV5S_20135 [Vibrio astriarenae]
MNEWVLVRDDVEIEVRFKKQRYIIRSEGKYVFVVNTLAKATGLGEAAIHKFLLAAQNNEIDDLLPRLENYIIGAPKQLEVLG